MTRQRNRRVYRYIEKNPDFTRFKPSGVPRNQIERVELLVDEYEAMRLSDLEGLSMQEGAEKMGVSAPTFNRMVNSGHKKVTDAIVYGKGIRVYTQGEKIGSFNEEF